MYTTIIIPSSQGINSLELAMDAVTSIQKNFYKAYPPHASEPEYKFEVPSTMKPTITEVRMQNISHCSIALFYDQNLYSCMIPECNGYHLML